MIQATTETAFRVYIQTEDNRINNTVAKTQIRHLMKFTNDMDKSIQYAYGTTETINNRYTVFLFDYNTTPDIYTGKTKLIPSGYYKYECYEVSWTGVVAVTEGKAPTTETEILEPDPGHGIVQGLVTKGKMYVADKAGTEQVQYTQRQEPSGQTNYIYYGQ
tara:strand:- start:34 stop:516 length:483 start_codon:yes stop_codon:yes gene_type:complete